MATHSSVLAWRIPGTGEPGGLPSLTTEANSNLLADQSGIPFRIPDSKTGKWELVPKV